MDDNFRIGPRFENVTLTQKKTAKLLVVVDLAIECDPDSAILVGQRLMARTQVDNGEPPMPQPHIRSKVHSIIIRTAMADSIQHPLDCARINTRAVVEV